MVWFFRASAEYNVVGAIAFVTPGALDLVGVPVPPSPVWLWIPALFAVFAAVVLWISSSDLDRYGAFLYYNGLVRLAFVVLAFTLDFAETAGAFMNVLVLVDLALALILGLPLALGNSHWDLSTHA
jgi:hypothetical protein